MSATDDPDPGAAPSWTLPRLTGRRRSAATIVYLLVAAFSLAVALSGVVGNGIDMFRNLPAVAQLGLRTTTLAAGGSAIDDADAAARAAGVTRFDRITAIDGVALPASASEFVIGKRLDAADGERVALDLRDTQGREHRVVLARSVARWSRIEPTTGLPVWLAAAAQYVTDILPSLFLLLASWMLYRRRPSDPVAMLLALGFALLSNGEREGFGANSLVGVPVALLGDLHALGWGTVFVGVAGFPDGRIDNRWAKLVAVAAVPLIFASHAIGFAGNSGIVRRLFDIGDLAVPLAALVAAVVRYRRLPPGTARQQVKWAVMGFVVMVSAVLILILLSLMPWDIAYNRGPTLLLIRLLTIASLCALPAGLLVSLLRYRLYDADAAISRSIAYGLMTVALLAIFAGSEKLIEVLGEHYFGERLGAVAGGLSAAIAAVMIVPLHHRATHWAEHRFQRALIKLRHGLPILAGDLRETSDMTAIAEVVLDEVVQGVNADHAALIVADRIVATRGVATDAVTAWRAEWAEPDSPDLSCDRHDGVFPVRVPLAATGHGRVGWLVLGPRPDGSLYGKDERKALGDVADPVARALAIAERRQQRDADLDRRITALSDAVAALRRDAAARQATTGLPAQ